MPTTDHDASQDPGTEGFDNQAGETWIYPTNLPIREYQFKIVQEALFKNTLVSLPTGLGKTFIAAVVMYNYYRWYPTGKIIFMAPTRPLVKQQIDACYNIMAIPPDVTAELTGLKAQTSRKDIWKEKRVFFVTAQVLANDLDFVSELGTNVKCLVFDEAHRAKGNHAYCQVIKKLLPLNKHFRVLALSATPGSNANDVVEVIQNLLISHIEYRTDASNDVTPYTFQRSLETVVVPIGDKLQEVRDKYIIQILEKYTRPLVKYRVIQGNCGNLTKGKIFMCLKEFQERNRTTRIEGYADITRTLNICITLYHAFELLIRHGLRSFLSFYEEHAEKPLLRGNVELQEILRDVREYLGPFPHIEPLPDGSTPDIPSDVKYGHPKFYKLCDILLAHFTAAKDISSRVMVFCEYRESVKEAYVLLLQQKPLIRPKIFLGQSEITQKKQISVMQSFRKGECNTLISTCIGEEGLDVGEIDLIVCFDISNKSPVRLIQRIGRTGRKREGRVVLLVTEGREQQTLQQCLLQRHNLSNNVLGSATLSNQFYPRNPRMIPENISPACHKMFITVKEKESKKTNRTIKGMFSNMQLSQGSATQAGQISESSLNKDRIPCLIQFWDKTNPKELLTPQENKLDFSKNLHKQRKLQPVGIINHSKCSEMLVSLLQCADSKRYNILTTQIPVVNTQNVSKEKSDQVTSEKGKKSPKKTGLAKIGSFKQTDLKSMFLKGAARSEQISSESPKDVIDIIDSDDDFTADVNAVVDDIEPNIPDSDLDMPIEGNECLICDNFFDCYQYKIPREELKPFNWTVPDLSILDNITEESLNVFASSLSPTSKTLLINSELPPVENTPDKNQSFRYEPPKTFMKILTKCNMSINEDDDFKKPNSVTRNTAISENDINATLEFFKLKDLDDLFESCNEKNNTDDENAFNNSSDTVIYSLGAYTLNKEEENKINECVDVEQLSPVLNKSYTKDEDGSPILCSFDRLKYLKDKAQRKLFNSQKEKSEEIKIESPVRKKPKLSNLFRSTTSFFNSSTSKRIKNHSENKEVINQNERDETKDELLTSFSDICDPSLLEMITPSSLVNTQEKCIEVKDVKQECTEQFAWPDIKELDESPEENHDHSLNKPKTSASEKLNTALSVSLEDIFDASFLDATITSVKEKPKTNDDDRNKKSNNPFLATIKKHNEEREIHKNNTALSTDSQQSCKENRDHNILNNTFQSNNKSNVSDYSKVLKNFKSNFERGLKRQEDQVIQKQMNVSKTKERFQSKDVQRNISKHITLIEKDTKLTNSVKNNNIFDDTFDNGDLEFVFNQTSINSKAANSNCEEKSNQTASITLEEIFDTQLLEGVKITTWNTKNEQKIVNSLQKNELKSSTNALEINKTQKSNECTGDDYLKSLLDIDDICDLSMFDFNKGKSGKKPLQTVAEDKACETKIEDICDISIFGIDENFKSNDKNATSSQINKVSDLNFKNNIIENQQSNIKDKKITQNSKSNSTLNESKLSITQILDCVNTPLVQKCNRNKSFSLKNKKALIKSDSEDEFEKTFISTVKKKPKLSLTVNTPSTSKKKFTSNSDDDFEFPSSPKIVKKNIRQLKKGKQTNAIKKDKVCGVKKQKNGRQKNPFIEIEAEVSEEEGIEISDDEHSSEGDNILESSFVNDETQAFENTQMHALYLQSVRSPHLNRGKFKIPQKSKVIHAEIYSQVVDMNDTYLNDSFCVGSQEASSQNNTEEPSTLEIAEQILEAERREKKRKKNKRKRILQFADDSD